MAYSASGAPGGTPPPVVSLEENIRRKRCRPALEDLRSLTTYPRIVGVSQACQCLLTFKPVEGESEDNKLIRLTYEFILRAYEEGARGEWITTAFDQITRIDLPDSKILPRKLHALKLLCACKGALTAPQKDKLLTTLHVTLRDTVEAFQSSASAKLSTKDKKIAALRTFCAPAIALACRVLLKNENRAIMELEPTFLEILRCAAAALAECCRATTAVSEMWLHKSKSALEALQGSVLAMPSTGIYAKHSFIRESWIQSAGRLRRVSTASGKTHIAEMARLLRDKDFKVFRRAVHYLAETGVGSLYHDTCSAFPSHERASALREVAGMIRTVSEQSTYFCSQMLAAGDSPKLCTLLRCLASFASALSKLDAAWITAQRTLRYQRPKAAQSSVDSGPRDIKILRGEGLDCCARIIELASRIYVFCASTGSAVYRLPAFLAVRTILHSITSPMLTGLFCRASASLPSKLRLLHRRTGKAFIFLWNDAMTRFAGIMRSELLQNLRESLRKFSHAIPRCNQLADGLEMGYRVNEQGWCAPDWVPFIFSHQTLKTRDAVGCQGYERSLVSLAVKFGLQANELALSPLADVLPVLAASYHAEYAGIVQASRNSVALRFVTNRSAETARLATAQLSLDALYGSARARERMMSAWSGYANDFANSVSTRAPKSKRSRDLPFGTASAILPTMFRAQPTYTPAGITNTDLYAGKKPSLPASPWGPFSESGDTWRKQERSVTPVFSLTRPTLGLAVIDEDFVDSTKLGAERVIRRLHRCVGSFIVAASSVERIAVLPGPKPSFQGSSA